MGARKMEGRKIVLGSEHPDALISMWNLAHTWEAQDRKVDAIGLLQDCVDLFEEYLGPTRPNTIDAIVDLESLRQNIA
ncbi:hypothetical protein ASPACDRAFT_125851 [Aspergillus aculeatus ATCC 16872]|uniref:Uncharacterized protein n=1 Tax=Aspergillus aculeatus (strain ATCC 16872 / CBS 172.66 / WB 5094) TaxID=690307 RepID=A0A1L9WJG9_ASPA1|nr:uncharacterized protein ASPACDRAFT_125851 [Aspergillus aculeatus ATCC 16872]OJJ96288.1 hypothetical protein ASPACDRAFT_125851 [Aspergillus aculeatus ATCC 16872]